MSKKIAFLIAFTSLFWLQFTKIDVPAGFTDESNIYKINYVIARGIFWAARTAESLNFGTESSNAHHLLMLIINQTKALSKKSVPVEIVDTKIKSVEVKIFRLSDAKNLPVLIYFHGGGYAFGHSDIYESALVELALKSKVVIISVNYRLAPFYPYPAPTSDCYTVTKYVMESGNEFGDTNRVILAGDSAGGNAVAVVSQRLLAENLKQPKLQVLIYPWLQMFNIRLPSMTEHSNAGLLSIEIEKFISWYLGYKTVPEQLLTAIKYNNHTLVIKDQSLLAKYKAYTDVSLIPQKYKSGKRYYEKYEIFRESVFPKELDISIKKDKKMMGLLQNLFTPEMSPGLADPERLKGLPKAHFVMCETDAIKDEGLIYSERLRQVGVKTNVQFYEDCFHGVFNLNDPVLGFKIARKMIDDLAVYISQNV